MLEDFLNECKKRRHEKKMIRYGFWFFVLWPLILFFAFSLPAVFESKMGFTSFAPSTAMCGLKQLFQFLLGSR